MTPLLYRGAALLSQSPAPRSVAHCGCGAQFAESAWAALPLGGQQHLEADGLDAAEVHEQRRCRCGSTISCVVTARDNTTQSTGGNTDGTE